ncbi:MAG: thioredoxin family protein [Pirellulaceae bacterium]
MQNKGFRVRRIDAGHNESMVRKYWIRSVPTFIYERDGEEVRRRTGHLSERSLRRLCRDTWL